MAQLSASQSGVADLRTQLTSFETSASSAKSVLESEVQMQRTKKKSEDHMRAELRSRIKSLEEEKRSAEGVRREREKSLSHALTRKKEVEKRLEKLAEEISAFRNTIGENGRKRETEEAEMEGTIKEYEENVENVKREIEVAEKVLAQLNEKVKDVEDQVGEEKTKIASFQEKRSHPEVPTRPQTKRFEKKDEGIAPWPPVANPESSPPLTDGGTLPVQPADDQEVTPVASRPRHLSLGGISNVLARRRLDRPAHSSSLPLPAAGVQPQSAQFYGRFAPFDAEQESNQLSPGTSMVSPLSPGVSMSLIPSGIMDTPGGLEGDEDFVLAPERVSPTSVDGMQDDLRDALNFPASYVAVPELKFEQESYSPEQTSPEPAHQQRFERFDSQRAFIRPVSETAFDSADFSSEPYSLSNEERVDSGRIKSRKWFSKERDDSETRDQEITHKGLNPDAKIFKFTRKTPFLNLSNTDANGMPDPTGSLLDTPPLIDPLNPSGPPPMPPPPTPRTSFFTSLRAFQPSPAEREALRLAMVSSANNSLERLGSSGSHHSGGSQSPPATSAGPILPHGPFLGPSGAIPRTSNPHIQSLQGQAHVNSTAAFGARNPWITSSNHTSSHSLDALATATVQAVNGEATSSNGESSFTSAPPHKKSFSFNPWGGDRLLGNK
jgi:predicted  nucleic acid-binding Zn-ribbon protein